MENIANTKFLEIVHDFTMKKNLVQRIVMQRKNNQKMQN